MKKIGLVFVIMYTIVMLVPLQIYAVGDKLVMNATLESRKVEAEVMQNESIKPKMQILNENRKLKESMDRQIMKKPFKKNKSKKIIRKLDNRDR